MGDYKGPTVGGPAFESGDGSTPSGHEVDPMAVGPGDGQGSKVTRGPLEDQEIAALWKLGPEKLDRNGGALGQQRAGILELGNGQGVWTRAEGRGDGGGEFRLLAPRALETLGEGESSQRHFECELWIVIEREGRCAPTSCLGRTFLAPMRIKNNDWGYYLFRLVLN